MRIALLSYRSKPHCGGQGVYVRHLARELAVLGHAVEIFSGQPYPELDDVAHEHGVRLTKVPSLDLYGEPDPFRTPRLREIRDWIDVLEVATMWTAGFPEPLTFSLRMARILRRRPDDFDVVHDNQSLGYGLLAIARRGLPLVATIHHPITRDRSLAVRAARGWRKLTAVRWHGFARMQGHVARRIPVLLTVSRSSAMDIRRAFGIPAGRIATIPLGVDTEVFRPGAHRVANRVVCVASADAPLKGVAYLLEAIAKLAVERPVRLTLVSRLDPDGPTARRISDLGIDERVSLVSDLTDGELAELIASAQVACVPSLYEGFSLPVIESMSCATPLVVTTAGAIPEVAGPDGEASLHVPPMDSDALAASIGRLLDDAELRDRLGRGGRARVQSRFGWAAVAARTAEQYTHAMEARRADR